MLNIPSKPPRYTNSDKGAVSMQAQTPLMFSLSQNSNNNIGLFPNKPLPPPQAGSEMARNATIINNAFSKPLGTTNLGSNSNTPVSQPSLGLGLNLSNSNTSDNKFAGSFIAGAPLFGNLGSNNKNGTILGNAQLFKDVPHTVANPILKNLASPTNKSKQTYPTFPQNTQDAKKHFPLYHTSKLNPDKENSVKYIKCIAAIKQNFENHKNKEMLRVQYYTQNYPKFGGNQNQLPSLASLSSNNSQHNVLFSNPNQPVNNPFKTSTSSQQSPGLFGNLPPPVHNNATTGLFGTNAESKTLFAAQPTVPSMFGSSNTQQAHLFGKQAQENTALFGNIGNSNNTGLFCSQPQGSPQNTQTNTASLFTISHNNAPSLLGNQTATENFNLRNQNVQNGAELFPPQIENSNNSQYSQISWYNPTASQQQNQCNEIIFNCLHNIRKNQPTQLTQQQLDHIQMQWSLYNKIFQLYEKIIFNFGCESAKYYFLQFDDDIFDRLIYNYHQLLTFGKIRQNDVFLIELKKKFQEQLTKPTEYTFEYFYQGYIHNDGQIFYGDQAFKKKLSESESMVRQIFAQRRNKNEYFVPLTAYTRHKEETIFPVNYIPSNSCFLTDQNDDSAPGARKPFDYECLDESELERTNRYYKNMKPTPSWKDREVRVTVIDERRKK